jgi:hypothetical protein
LRRTAIIEKDMIAFSRVIAKGRRIRDIARLVATYGGTPAQWVKKSGPPFEREGQTFEYRWYEHHGIGRFEIKLKRVD